MLEAKFLSDPHYEGGIVIEPQLEELVDIEHVSRDEIVDTLKRCRNRSAPGLDKINYKTLKELNKKHPQLLYELYNACMRWGVFSLVWHERKLSVLLKTKTADKCDPASYRPLTLLSTMGKVLEQLIVKRTRKFTDSFIEDTQYGFRPGMGTEECIVKVTKAIGKMRSLSEYTVAVALDIRGAFDHLLWSHILKVLKEYGVPQYLIALYISYFRNRGV